MSDPRTITLLRQRPRITASRYLIMASSRQEGAVLIVALAMLVILTLIGIAGMTSTSLEEKMSANTQESTRAFQAAETGIAVGYNNLIMQNTIDDIDNAAAPIGDSRTTQLHTVAFQTWANPPVGSGWDAAMFRAAMFRIDSTGTNGSDVTRSHVGGAYRIAPKP